MNEKRMGPCVEERWVVRVVGGVSDSCKENGDKNEIQEYWDNIVVCGERVGQCPHRRTIEGQIET